MTPAPNRLLLYVCGIYLQLNNCLLEDIMTQFEIKSTTSWMDAYQNPPNESFHLISPFKADEAITEIRNLTDRPIYVNGFTYGDVGKGVVIQMSDSTRDFSIYCRSAEGSSEKPGGRFTYQAGRDRCRVSNNTLFPDINFIATIGMTFRSTVFWTNNLDVSKLFTENKTKYCMLLDVSAGQLMLENCSRSHEAVYVLGDYKQTIKRYIDSTYPFYDPAKNKQETTTTTGTADPLASTLSTVNNPSKISTNQHGENHTDKPTRDPPGPKDPNAIQDIFGMNADIFYTLVGVGSVVLVVILVCLCCCLTKRKGKTRSRPALSEDYSNPVDSIGMKEAELNSNSNNGVYANPQDSISIVKAKKRDSIGEGVYDVTSLSGHRKPNVNPGDRPTNAYAHVTIQPPGDAQSDDTENHYDSACLVKPKQTVHISSAHSEHTYGEVQLKMDT